MQLVDNLRGIVLFDWRGKSIYNYLAWQRTLDKWLFTVAAFWNPDTPASFGAFGGPVFMEVRSSLVGEMKDDKIVNYIYGLGGRDINLVEIENVYNDLFEIV